MLEIIIGEEGKGKTKVLLEKANNDVKVSGGTVIYIDQNNKHIYELSNRIRFINVQDFSIENSEMFLGFILGLISSDHDLDKIFLDNFKILSKSHSDTLETILDKLYELSEKYEIDFIVSLSMPADELPEKFKKLVVKAL
jgi:RecA/RadA recombinase